MTIPPISLGITKGAEWLKARNAEMFSFGQAHGLMNKSAEHTSVHALAGRLQAGPSGNLELTVPSSLIKGVFDALDEPGAEFVVRNNRTECAIKVMTKEEVDKLGGTSHITERGHSYHYTLGPIVELPATGDYDKLWAISIKSNDLEDIRKSYGLETSPQLGFYIPVGCKKKKVTEDNKVSKLASDDKSKKELVRVKLDDNDGKSLTHHYLTAKKWDYPAGKVESNEDRDDAAVRELRERTGHHIDKSKLKYNGHSDGFHQYSGSLSDVSKVEPSHYETGEPRQLSWKKEAGALNPWHKKVQHFIGQGYTPIAAPDGNVTFKKGDKYYSWAHDAMDGQLKEVSPADAAADLEYSGPWNEPELSSVSKLAGVFYHGSPKGDLQSLYKGSYVTPDLETAKIMARFHEATGKPWTDDDLEEPYEFGTPQPKWKAGREPKGEPAIYRLSAAIKQLNLLDNPYEHTTLEELPVSKLAGLLKQSVYWSKDVSRDLLNGRKYPLSYLTGELGELGESVKNMDWPNFKEELGDSAYAAQMILAQKLGLNLPLIGASAPIDKFYARRKGWEEVFKERGVPFSNDYLAGGSNLKKPKKIQAALGLAGHAISKEDARTASLKYGGGIEDDWTDDNAVSKLAGLVKNSELVNANYSTTSAGRGTVLHHNAIEDYWSVGVPGHDKPLWLLKSRSQGHNQGPVTAYALVPKNGNELAPNLGHEVATPMAYIALSEGVPGWDESPLGEYGPASEVVGLKTEIPHRRKGLASALIGFASKFENRNLYVEPDPIGDKAVARGDVEKAYLKNGFTKLDDKDPNAPLILRNYKPASSP